MTSLRHVPLIAAALCGVSLVAQTPLPSAPSTVLALQDEALAKPAGSAAVFTAPSSTAGPFGTIELPTTGPLQLSLDDAISFGLSRNLRLRYDRANQREVKGDELAVIDALVPSLTLSARTTTQEINLAGMGFKPSLFAGSHLLPAGFVLHEIVKVDTTEAQVAASQQLFNLSAYELYLGAKNEKSVVDLDTLNGRGDLVLSVGTAYLKVLADQATVQNAEAEEVTSKTLFSQATDRLQAGVGTNLDSLRAQVAFQQRQQGTIAAANQLAKDTIQLNRIMGLPAGQELQLTDTEPFAAWADMDLDKAKATAYAHRKDLLSLQAQLQVSTREMRAVKYQRLPTLAFNGFYGVLGETEGLYHGVFAATGSLRFPIFHEAEQRGEEELISSQISSLQQRIGDSRVAIDSQIRASMLDVTSYAELVKVAESNVELAKQELSDENDRFTAGVDTNLAVEDAQTSVTGADAQLVQALYQYNVAKLYLARNTGVVETRYRTYLGK